ncbi:MAG: hypothetical protein ACSLEZ_05125 [Thiobacillus sp.]
MHHVLTHGAQSLDTKERMMKIGMMMAMTVLFNLGIAHAGTAQPNPGFDRVGVASSDRQRLAGERNPTADIARFKAAPGESAEASVTNYPARKREMARRLVWLMLSAR